MPDLAAIRTQYEAATKLLEVITGEAAAFSEFDKGTDDAFRRIVELSEEAHTLLSDLPDVVEALEEAQKALAALARRGHHQEEHPWDFKDCMRMDCFEARAAIEEEADDPHAQCPANAACGQFGDEPCLAPRGKR